MKLLRLKLVHMLLGPSLKDLTTRALVQGSEIWWECANDPAMQLTEGDRETVVQINKELDELSDFWTI